MKIECPCGALIHDGGDDLPHKAHVIPDQGWHDLLDTLDGLIERPGGTPAQREAACMAMRHALSRARRNAWQCDVCGRLHLDDRAGRVRVFRPERDDGAARGVLRRRDG